ncbi:MAG: hypothetical protein V1913_10295 [Fibrobacterota bacterium]
MMKGTVFSVNSTTCMVAVQTEDGEFTVFELLENEPVAPGDDVEWKDGASLGPVVVTDYRLKRVFEAFFHAHHLTRMEVSQQLVTQE